MAQQPPAVRLSMKGPDVAVLTLDQPGERVNLLSAAVLAEFDAHFEALSERTELAGLVICSAKPGIFIAGADLKELRALMHGNATAGSPSELCDRGRNLFARLSTMPFVTVAAISGACMGGGSEMSSWCDRRIFADDARTQFAFPEVKIGIIPGWGGTVRLPRLIGLSNAVELICSGEGVDGRKARALGLATDVVPNDRLMDAAIDLIRAEGQSGEFKKDRERWSRPIDLSDDELAFLNASSQAYLYQQTKGHYPAPMAALEVMIRGAKLPAEQAGRLETEGFASLATTPVARSLVHVFFMNDRIKKDRGVEAKSVEGRPIKSVGVIGAGLMGSGIAAANLRRELPVTLTDADEQALRKGVARALDVASYSKEKKTSDPAKAMALVPLLRATSRDAEFDRLDLIIEAVVERPDVKIELLGRVESRVRPDAILASNTSTISIGRLAEHLKHPERFVGIHFFNPVHRMPLVEIIRGPKTNDETVATAVAYAKALGKSPIVVNDAPGFLVNRLLLPYMNEAIEVVLEGASISAVDRAIRGYGMPMGPLTLFDVVGIDTAYFAGKVMHAAFADRMAESPVLGAMVKAGRLGQKTGSGFYRYEAGALKGKDDPDVEALLAPFRRGQKEFTNEQIVARLFLPMVLEATRALDEKLVRGPYDVDAGVVLGIGYPPFRGGICFWADTVGAKKLLEQLAPLAELGERYRPTPMLEEMARTGKGFYG